VVENRESTPAASFMMKMNRFWITCPRCGGENSEGAGGNRNCFHCDRCGYVECADYEIGDPNFVSTVNRMYDYGA
jgi:hypothetical protein